MPQSQSITQWESQSILNVSQLKTWIQSFSLNVELGSWIWLMGDVGSGKTTFANTLIESLTGHNVAGSPTFPIISSYERLPHYETPSPLKKVLHGDLYRLHHPGDLMSLGLDLEWTPHCLFCIEWGDLFTFEEWASLWPMLGLPLPQWTYQIYFQTVQEHEGARNLSIKKLPGFAAPTRLQP